uniref:Rho GTPase-activating protein 20-like isoform X2 n=2 Tax=Crassostrea virginica TaxID=6565 RepID=A0A8B8AKE0_CRAVI|nr:rho GTPase-activating protein 20-like isoform X2 [Crassostrea virginica]
MGHVIQKQQVPVVQSDEPQAEPEEVQRIPDYEKYLSDLLEATDPQHPDYEDLSKAANRAKTMVKEHEDELGTNNDQIKMDRIQQRFPNDDLQLRENTPPSSRSLSARRKSAPGAVLFKSLGKTRSSSNLWSNSSMGKKEMDLVNPLRHGGNSQRQFILEGHVEFAQGMQTQDRYLFLFNDLLLVAKQKSSTTFKLKHRIRVCEIWLATCIYDVSEATLPPDKSFVLGWPVTNVVATFKSVELKELWLNKLNETIELERMKEANKTVKVKVHSRDLDQTCTLQIDNHTTAKDLLSQCVGKFHITESEASECQLWVKTGKEESPYPLIGHELPHSIKFSQLRDFAKTDDPMVSLDGMDPEGEGKSAEFILQNRLKGSKKQSFDESNKGNKSKSKKSPFNFFKRGKDDKNNNTTPPGKLFGHPLQDVMQEGHLPKPVLELMKLVITNGPYTKGVFRKSCNVKLAKEIHQKLDEGLDCVNGDTPTLVVGHLLKEYLRSLPHCLLYEDLYEEWISLSEEENNPQKLEKVRSLLNKLPEGHLELLKHLLCVLYHIDKNNKENMMTSYNLSVCIAPSILWAKQGDDPMRALAMAKSPQQIVEYLIVNCVELFGEDVIYLFGDLLEHKIRQDSSTDSDSMHSVLSMGDSAIGSFVAFPGGSIIRHDDSSVESLERMYFDDSSPNLAKSHISPSSLSRDSGLYSSQENLDNGAKSRVNTTLVKSRSGCHLYFEDEPVSYPTEINGPITRINRDRDHRLQRQKSVAESTPPTSPHSKLSYSSLDSSLTDSMSSYLNRQYSKDTDNSDQWFTAEESFRDSFDSTRECKDDSSINFQRSNSLSATIPKSIQNIQHLVSPPVSPRSKRKSSSMDLHLNLSQTKSYPLPRTCFSQEKLSDPTSARYGQSAMDLSSSNPLKQLSKYSTPGLGTSPPPHIVLQQHKSVQKPSPNTPMRASYDSAIISQFEKKDTFKTEMHVTKHVPTPKSENESDMTLTNNSESPSVSRPEKPPSYDEAVRRKKRIDKGLPLEILTEQDIQEEKEKQRRAKSLYIDSINKFEQDTRDESTSSESESESTEEDVYVSLKNPKKIWEESLKLYEEESSQRRPPHYDNKNVSNVSATNIQRSSSDSADYMNKVSMVAKHREPSPNYRVPPHHREPSPSTTRLSHSSSSVSNSSSETVTDSRQSSPNQRERSESSPVVPRHHFPKTSPMKFKANYAPLDSAQSSSSIHKEQTVNNPALSRDSRTTKSPPTEVSKSVPKLELSVHNPSSYSTPQTRVKRVVKSHDFVDSPVVSSPRTISQESPRKNLTVLSKSRNSTVITNHRDLYARSSTVRNRVSASLELCNRDSEKSPRKQDLPWSVKSLKQIYDKEGAPPSSDNVKDTGVRPPPPPYQPPPPFRRPDFSRLSQSSQSSVGSGNTGRSTPPIKGLPTHRRSGGPQTFSYRKDQDPDISYV